MLFEVLIIGGGPGGLTAGLYTSRARLSSLLIEKAIPGGQVATIEWVENYPGFDEGVAGFDLSQKMENQAKKFGLEIIQGDVSDIKVEGNIKKVSLEDGQTFEAKSIILAVGASPRLLNIEGETKYRGKGVSYCATCDGAFFRDKKIAVIGGGSSAIQEAIFLTRFAEVVYIVHRRDELRAEKVLQERAFSNPKIKFIWNSVPEKIDGADTVESLHVKNVKTGEAAPLEVQGVFIYIGYNPSTEFLKGLVRLDEQSYIITDDNMATSAPGIFAVGDVRSGSVKQISTATGDGTVAAINAEKYIEENF
ncbi:MAG: thioredoxin-disulfide reductase [Nitrospirae bacterium]|nr:thioredoxin-disulfide reductase [Nitrospirota bacterium]